MTKDLKGSLIDESPVFLQKPLNFFAVVTVLFTTLFGWFNPIGWCVLFVVLCRLLDGNPINNLKAAFTNPLFLVYFVYFVIDATGYLYTHDLGVQGRVMSKESMLVAIAFVFCAGKFADSRSYRQLITAYCLLLAVVSLYCLVLACRDYRTYGVVSVFFYHTLTAHISQNAVFVSVYVLFGIVFLLSSFGEPAIVSLSQRWRKFLRYAMLIFFLIMMVLLSSRLMLVITPLILIDQISRRYSSRKRKLALLIAGLFLILGIGVIFSFNNFVRWRFGEIRNGQMAYVKQKTFDPNTRFSSWDLRLVQWRFAFEIMEERHGWLFGVSPGDGQNLLDQKYISSNMYIGNPADGPNRHIRGFLGFNFHDQYMETFVRSGLVGLASLVSIFVVLFARARRFRQREAWIVLLTIAVFFLVESPLTLQHGVFLFCFFPLLTAFKPKTGLIHD